MVIQKKILKLRYFVDISSKNGDMYVFECFMNLADSFLYF